MDDPSSSVLAGHETTIEITISDKWAYCIEAELERHKASTEALSTLLPVVSKGKASSLIY